MKLKSKYFPVLFIVGILILLIGSALIVANWVISEHAEKQIESKINQFQFYVNSLKNQAIENKIILCNIIAKNENLISAVENKDAEAIHSILFTYYNTSSINLILVTDEEGHALIKSEIFNIRNDVFSFPGVHGFLSKINPSNNNYLIWSLVNKDNNYLISAVPIRKNKNIIGTLNIGYIVSEFIKIDSFNDIEIAIINGKNVLQSSLNFKQESIEGFLNVYKPIVEAVLATSLPSDIFSTAFDEKEVYSKIIPFGSGVPVLILVSISKSEEFLFLDK